MRVRWQRSNLSGCAERQNVVGNCNKLGNENIPEMVRTKQVLLYIELLSVVILSVVWVGPCVTWKLHLAVGSSQLWTGKMITTWRNCGLWHVHYCGLLLVRHITHHFLNYFLTISFYKSNEFTVEFINSCRSHKNLMIDSPIHYTKMIEIIIFIISL